MDRAAIRHGVLLGLFLVLASGGAGSETARGSNVPASAESDALLYPPPLLDQPALVFRFPELVTRYESQLFMTADGVKSSSFVTGGVLGRLKSCGGFLLIQGREPWTVLGGTYGTSSLGSKSFQGGIGAAWGKFRAGLSVLGSLEGTEDIAEETQSSQDRLGSAYSRYRDDLLAVSTGLGWGANRVQIDGSIEVSWLDQSATDYSLTRAEGLPDDYWRIRFQRAKKPVITSALRAAFPVGGRGEGIVSGYLGQKHTSWTAAMANEVGPRLTIHPYVDNWGIEMSLARPLPKVDWFAASASYRTWRAATLAGAFRGWKSGLQTNRTGAVGFSLRKKLLPDLQGYAGVRGTYHLWRDEFSGVTDLGQRSTSGESTDEDLDGGAAWGLSYVWKDLRIMGRVSSTFELSRPFLSVDASFRL